MSKPVEVAPSQERFVTDSGDSGEKCQDKKPDVPLPSSYLRQTERDDSSGAASYKLRKSLEEEENSSRYYFMSEPSLSEDPSDSLRGSGLSPHTGSPHLYGYSSPSGNTSISSKEGMMPYGSPQQGNRKRPVFWQESLSLLGPMKDEKEGDNNLLVGVGGNEKKGHKKKLHSQISANERNTDKKLTIKVGVIPESRKNHQENLNVPSINTDFSKKAHRLVKEVASPDSARYMSAQESFEEEHDSDNSSNLSYASSSVEENANKWVSTDKLLSPKSPNVVSLLKETMEKCDDTNNISSDIDQDKIVKAGPPSSEIESKKSGIDENVASPKDGSPTSRVSLSSVEKPNKVSRRHTIPHSEDEETAGLEGTCPRSRRKRIHSNESSGGKRSGHRRTRSGDSAAATLITGGNDWIGMSLDQLPMPDERENIEDDEEDGVEPPMQRRRGASFSSLNKGESTTEASPQRRKTKKSPLQELKDQGGDTWDTIRGSSIDADNVIPQIDEDERSSDIKLSSRFDPQTESNSKKTDKMAKPSSPTRTNSVGEWSSSTVESGSTSAFSWITNKHAISSKIISVRENTESNISDLDGEQEQLKESTFSSKNVANEEAIYKEKIHTSIHGNGRGKKSVGKHLEFLEEQRKKSEAYEAHMRTLGRMPNFEQNYKPQFVDKAKKYPTYICPRCNTEQREFFTVASAPKYLSSPAGYMGICFVIYVTASLFIFGLQEGWPPLDCIYFSVITLTTCGLGDYVPTTDSAKLICSIFVYFGVACMGLLLGQLHVNTLDEASNRAAEENKVNNCPNCARQMQSLRAPFRHKRSASDSARIRLSKLQTSEIKEDVNGIHVHSQGNLQTNEKPNPTAGENIHLEHTPRFALQTIDETNQGMSTGFWNDSRSPHSIFSPGSAAVEQVLDRQSHTRHISLLDSQLRNKSFYEQMTASPAKNTFDLPDGRNAYGPQSSADHMDDISEVSSYWSNDSSNEDLFRPVSHIKAAKYIFLTLKQAVANSAVVIALGSIGFYYIENLSLVDAIYFTVVLLSTVGYGDITPVTSEGKLFATLYGLLAHTVLLHNMSMISMIPLELRKRRIERAVLMQFGTDIDDAALRELANGPIVKRLQISENNQPDGLNNCTREMFALAMLVRLGRITEQDVRSTYAAFRKLDKDGDGVLTSKEIIMGAVERERRKPKQEQMNEFSRDSFDRQVHHQPVEQTPLYQHSHAADSEEGENARLLMRTRGRGMSMESQMSAMTYEDEDVETGEYQTFNSFY